MTAWLPPEAFAAPSHGKISVAVLTYNHEAFLAQALDGVLSQVTSYSYDVFVLDDSSTDGTASALLSYAERHPGRIQPILHRENVGALRSASELLSQLPGEYVALLEGDDYWIDRTKLETQVAFLDEHPDFVLCGHNCVVRNEWLGSETVAPGPSEDCTLDSGRLLDFHIPTASMVFRNHLVHAWPERLVEAGFGDRPLAIMLAQLGRVRYLARPMSIYRIHPGGAWSGHYLLDPTSPVPQTSAEGWRKLSTFWGALNEYLEHRHDTRIQQLLDQAQRQIERLTTRAGPTQSDSKPDTGDAR
jgi:glycosyltransferase involved in cell wall biosynthesis